ncbi:uncharacterized protein LOC132035198 [Lycium ferocissimum]|uniref:uncharacterized protein LOC132035198 n=1 Tax=Lycium ferocissimum TaxID=112874 RepID=UPI002814F58D|nr:uncharacterized protein LOC132035198 [Lycium ferocissimum]
MSLDFQEIYPLETSKTFKKSTFFILQNLIFPPSPATTHQKAPDPTRFIAMTSSLSPLGTALTIIFIISLLALFTQLLFLLWRRRRRRNNIPIHVHENVQEPSSSSSKELLLFLFCLKTQETNVSRVEPDPDPNPSSHDLVEMELIDFLKLHDMYGPSRFLFTINEEEREDLESEKSDEKMKSMSLKECVKIDEESPENSPENLPELPEVMPELPKKELVGEELPEEVAIDYDSMENKTTPFSTPCDSPFYLTPVASPSCEGVV